MRDFPLGGAVVGVKMAKTDALSVAQVWEERFHRTPLKGDFPTKNWVFFISRPTLEALRRADQEGKKAFVTLKREIEGFLQRLPIADQYRADFSVQTHIGERTDPASTPYVSFAYPFDVSEELRAQSGSDKLGVYVHYGTSSGSDIVVEDDVSIPLKKASMFDKEFISEIEKCLIRSKTPPKVKKADPMWMEFSSGKILPTDVLRTTEEQHWRTFQQLICSQFMEIRLIQHSKDMTNAAIREQVDALRTFSSFESGYSNFAGAPGTGKSTLLHMICAHQLYLEYFSGNQKKVLYYVASSYLKNEARREIERILQYVYDYNNTPKQGEIVTAKIREMVREKIVFCAQEDLFQINKPSYDTNIITGNNKKIARTLGINQNDKEFGEKINTFKRQLRQVIFGLFGEEEHYRSWSRRNEKKLRSAWQNQKLSLVNPRDAQSKEHNISMERFISFDKEYDQFNKHLQKIRKDIFDGNYRQNAYWDPSSVVIHSSKNYSENSIWAKHKGQIDQIIIDEIQDIAMSEVSLLLNHFSNRQHENPIAAFRFVGAGDENQSIKFLEYFPNNEHMNSLFKDWATSIRVQISQPSGVSLSHGLTPTQQESLVSSYRIPNVMVAYVRELLQHLRRSADTELKAKHRAKPTKLKKAPFGREGVLLVDDVGLKPSNQDKLFFEEWGARLLTQLEKQLLSDSDGPPKIAVIYDEYDWEDARAESGHGLHEYLKRKTEHSTLAKRLNALIEKAVEKIRSDLSSQDIKITSTEIKTGLASMGVMSVKAIQGLTVPLAIVLPPSKIRPIEHLEDLRNNMPRISKFLVGITRAQYLNLILTDTRVFQQQTKSIDSELEHNLVTDWLNNVLENSMGLTIPYSDLFERTLREYHAFTAWNELEGRTHQMAEDNNLKQYFEVMKEFHQVGLPQKSLSLNNDVWNVIENNLSKFQFVEETFGLQKRLHVSTIPSLKLFAVSNIMIRQGDNSTITAQTIANLFEEWVSNDNSNEGFVDTKNWLNLLVPPPEDRKLATYYSGNRLYEDINKLFKIKIEEISSQSNPPEQKWPRQQLPQLNMEGWRLVNKNTDEEDDDLAWMQPDSALYTVPQKALSLVIEGRMGQANVSEEFKTLSIKIWLYLSMTLDDAEMFCKAYVSAINQQQTWLNDWYVNLHQSFSSEHEQFFQQFQRSLENNIISNTSPSNPVKDELSRFFAGSDTIHELQQRLRAFSFERWNESTNFMDMFQRIVEITFDSLDDLETNPFAPGEYVHRFIKSHEESLGEKLYREMFYTLFATQEAIRTGNFSTHIANNNVEVPTVFGGNQELETAFIQCLNKWSTPRSETIQQLEADLVSLIAPAAQQDSKKQQTLDQWLTYFGSLRKHERSAGDSNKIQYNLIRLLQKSGGNPIVQEFLGYALNPEGSYSTNLPKERLRDYIGGKAAQLIYMLRTNDVEAPRGDALINRWKEITSYESTYIGNPDSHNNKPYGKNAASIKRKRFDTFSEMFRTAHDGLLANECGILRLKWLHRPIHVAPGFDREYAGLWTKRAIGQRIKVPLPFCSNATFAALAHLADEEPLLSADYFEEAGLFNHAFALRVNNAYDEHRDTRPELVATIAGLIRRDTFAGDNILYLDVFSGSPMNTTRSEYEGAKEEGDQYHYGLSRSFIREKMTLLDREIYQTDSPTNLKLSLKPSSEHHPYVLFFEHREWGKNSKLIGDSLEYMDKDVTDNNEYLSRMVKFHNGPWKSKTWSFRHRGLEANSEDENDGDSAISSIVFEYGMDTLNDQAKRGMKGYVPVMKSRHRQVPGKDNLVKFLLHLLNKNHLKEKRTSFASRLATLTGVSGATFVHLLPKEADNTQTMKEIQKKMKNEEESNYRRMAVKERISEILSDEKLPEARETLHYVINKKFEDGSKKEEIKTTVRDLGVPLLKRENVITDILNTLEEL